VAGRILDAARRYAALGVYIWNIDLLTRVAAS
jgi:hypothetical protein